MLICILALVLLLAGAGSAHAAFLVAPIATAVFGVGAAASIATAVGVAALSVGASFVVNKIFGPDVPKAADLEATTPGGVELGIRIAADVPQSLIVGRAVTAGSLVYQEAYGASNTDLVEIIALADHPCEGLVKTFIEDQEAALTDTATNRGFTVDGYNSKLALKFFDGAQSAADAFAVAALGAHTDRPWTSDMVGTGIAYVRNHSIYDRELVPGPMRWRYVIDGVKLYDPRLDSTVAGGSGSHRWDDLSTHEFTANLAVIAYNIARGVRVLDAQSVPRHFYGIEGTPAENLPPDVWFAAMNEADIVIDGEPQFHGGAEIQIDREPIEVIKEIIKACDGRFVENGGVYKLYMGAPGLPVASIDDGVIRADEADTFRPVLPLINRISHVTGKYTSPDDGWIEKIAQPRTNADAETAMGRRVPADLDAPFVQSGPHMQRLMKQILAKAQQPRRHVVPLPQALFGLEPGDIIDWTSVTNSYSSKLFEIDTVDIRADLTSTVSFTEVDATDYDWDAGTDLIPEASGSLTVARPVPKVVSSFAAGPVLLEGANGTKRAGIELTWDDPLDDDIVAVQFEVWLTSDSAHVATGRSDEPSREAVVYVGDLQSLTEYQVRARFISFNGFATSWSLPLAVTTLDARLALAEFNEIVSARMAQLDIASEAALARIIQEVDDRLDNLGTDVTQLISRLEEQQQTSSVSHGQVVTSVRAQLRDPDTGLAAAARAISALDAKVGDDLTAIATAFTQVFAESGEGSASSMIRFVAQAAPAGSSALLALEVKAEAAEDYEAAGLFLESVVGVGTRVSIIADLLRVQTDSGSAALFEVDEDEVRLGSNVALEANILRSPDEKFVIDLENKTILIET